LAEKITPTDDEMKAYYDKHKGEFYIGEPQKKIRYIFIDQDKSGQKVQVSDKELQDEFNNLQPQYKKRASSSADCLESCARRLDETCEEKS
jgi:hypothetical protein